MPVATLPKLDDKTRQEWKEQYRSITEYQSKVTRLYNDKKIDKQTYGRLYRELRDQLTMLNAARRNASPNTVVPTEITGALKKVGDELKKYESPTPVTRTTMQEPQAIRPAPQVNFLDVQYNIKIDVNSTGLGVFYTTLSERLKEKGYDVEFYNPSETGLTMRYKEGTPRPSVEVVTGEIRKLEAEAKLLRKSSKENENKETDPYFKGAMH